MCEGLPRSVDPKRLVEQRRSLTGAVGLDRLPRLAEVVVAGDGEPNQLVARFELRFDRDTAGRGTVRGEVSAALMLRCQRCNEPYEFPVESRFTLALVSGLDEARRLPDGYEPLLLERQRLDPAALVEDELLLALPAVPRHPEGACAPPAVDTSEGPGVEEVVDDAPNPFAVLGHLKRRH